MRRAAGFDVAASGLRLSEWLFGVRDAAASRERAGRAAGVLFLVAAGYALVVTPVVGGAEQRGIQVAVLVALAVSSAICFVLPWRILPEWAVHAPTVWWIGLFSIGTGAVGGVLDAYVVGYVLIFLYTGLTGGLAATARTVALAGAGLAVAGLVGAQDTGRVTIAAAIAVAAVAGQLLAFALAWNRAAAERVALVNESLVGLASADAETRAAQRVADLVADLVEADDAMVLLTEHVGAQTFVRRGGGEPGSALQDIKIDASTEQSGLVVAVRSGASLFLADAAGSPVESRRLVEQAGAASVLYIPIPGEGGVMGAVVAWWATRRQSVDPFALEVAELVAMPAGQVLQRLRHVGRLDAPAMRDPLTGVGNRRRFEAELTELPVGGTLLLFDLDAFAAVNDMYGHDAGDEALRGFAGALRRSVRENDVVTRLGDDAFAVILPARSSSIASGIIIERLQRAWRSPQGCRFSVGVAIRTEEEAPAETLARAESDLRATKRLKVR